jgi:hypothetical protein
MPAKFTTPVPPAPIANALIAALQALVYPQPVYAMGLHQVASGQPPEDSLFVGWRYLLSLDADIGVEVDIHQKAGGPPVYAGVSYGPIAAKAVRAAQQIANVPGIPDGGYEVRSLLIPGILTNSLWLRATTAASDWVVPYDTAVKALREMAPYEMTGFMNILRPFGGVRASLVLRRDFDEHQVRQGGGTDPDQGRGNSERGG